MIGNYHSSALAYAIVPVTRRVMMIQFAVALLSSTVALAQQSTFSSDARAADTRATLRIRVTRDSATGAPVEAALVRSGNIGARTDAAGEAVLQLPGGIHTVRATRVGLRPDSVTVTLGTTTDTTVAIVLLPSAAALEGLVVSATRDERRVEDTPLRVEVIDEEEIAEKVAMTPGDIAMMLNETSGLRVQVTNPSLGGANVRIQGLRGRYSLLLADGLPLYGGQAGGLGLLQIPPVDLGRVEVIKGTASALYGSAALGGVINLVSRRPGDRRESAALVNQTSRGGTDAVYFGGGPVSSRWGYTVLAGGHRQGQHDADGDGWTDLPGYERAVVRPRIYFDDGAGRTAFLTGGLTIEDRDVLRATRRGSRDVDQCLDERAARRAQRVRHVREPAAVAATPPPGVGPLGAMDDATLRGHRRVRAHALHRGDRGDGAHTGDAADRRTSRARRRTCAQRLGRCRWPIGDRARARGAERDGVRLARQSSDSGARGGGDDIHRCAPYHHCERALADPHLGRRAARPLRARARWGGGAPGA